jgi:hypothetical protein
MKLGSLAHLSPDLTNVLPSTVKDAMLQKMLVAVFGPSVVRRAAANEEGYVDNRSHKGDSTGNDSQGRNAQRIRPFGVVSLRVVGSLTEVTPSTRDFLVGFIKQSTSQNKTEPNVGGATASATPPVVPASPQGEGSSIVSPGDRDRPTPTPSGKLTIATLSDQEIYRMFAGDNVFTACLQTFVNRTLLVHGMSHGAAADVNKHQPSPGQSQAPPRLEAGDSGRHGSTPSHDVHDRNVSRLVSAANSRLNFSITGKRDHVHNSPNKKSKAKTVAIVDDDVGTDTPATIHSITPGTKTAPKMVAVRADEGHASQATTPTKFWIARVMQAPTYEDQPFKILYYDNASGDAKEVNCAPIDKKWYPCTTADHEDMLDEVSLGSVMVPRSFELTKDHRIPEVMRQYLL